MVEMLKVATIDLFLFLVMKDGLIYFILERVGGIVAQ